VQVQAGRTLALLPKAAVRDNHFVMSEESTTPDPVELLRSAFEALDRRDLDAVMRFYRCDAILDATRTLGTMFRGQAAIRRFHEDWVEAYEELRADLEDEVDLGNGVTFAVYVQRGRLFGTTAYVNQREAGIWEWVDGRLVSFTVYPEADIDEARAAAERLAQERG
jgi:ketosteroid isomerase-like protein